MTPEEIQHLTNADGFGYDTAFNVNQKVPDFGIRLEDGNHKVIRNALFSRLVKDEANPYNNIVELVYTADSGKQETVRLREREYHEVISCVQKLEESKREFASSDNKWNEYEWQKASLEYLRRMGLDDNTYRLNSAEDFVHNLAIHCRKDQVHNTEEAFKMAAQMLEAMPKYERKYYMKLRKDWDKKNGAGNWDKTHIIDVFNKNHASVQLNTDEKKNDQTETEQLKDTEIHIDNFNVNQNNKIIEDEKKSKEKKMEQEPVQWEYKYFSADVNVMNKAGLAGWEATGIGNASGVLCKRSIQAGRILDERNLRQREKEFYDKHGVSRY